MENIFDELPKDQEQENQTIFTKKNAVKDFAAVLAGNRTTELEPNWTQMLLRAENQAEKHRIRVARDAWQDEQKHRAHQAQQAADAARIDALKNVAIRNKAFYDQLMRTDGRVYWSTEVQRMMRADKAAQGLGWYSKK